MRFWGVSGWALRLWVWVVWSLVLATSPAAAVTFRDPGGGITMEVVAPPGASICFLRPAELFVAADCPGISPSAADGLAPEAAFAAYFLDGESVVTVIGARRPQPLPRRWSRQEGDDAVRGYTDSVRRQAHLATPTVSQRLEVHNDLQVIRATVVFPANPANPDAPTLFATAMLIGRDAVYTLQALGASADRAPAERALDALAPRVVMAAPDGPPVWSAAHARQATLDSASYKVGQACGSLLCVLMALAVVLALVRHSQGKPVGNFVHGVIAACAAVVALSVVLTVVRRFRTPRRPDVPTPTAAPAPAPTPTGRRLAPPDLTAARRGFETRIVTQEGYTRDPAPPRPPRRSGLERTTYRSPAGELAAYITPPPADGRRRPAVVWAHGGFGGIGSFLWEGALAANDQTAQALRTPELIVFYPSWRGENENPGRFEMYYGEVDDLLAAAAHVAALPGVDPSRVYLAGHSSGATLVLLAAAASDRFRAAFAFGPSVGLWDDPAYLSGLRLMGRVRVPFDVNRREEARLRSAMWYAGAIRRPTFLMEGERAYSSATPTFVANARSAGAPVEAFAVPGGDHFNVLRPLTRLLAERIARDTGPTCDIRFTAGDIAAAMGGAAPPREAP